MESIAGNRAHWNAAAHHWVGAGRRSWATDEVTWGVFGVPEADVGALPDVAGRDVVELGCGTGYVSAWLARRGARSVVGVDPTEGQLATARTLQREHRLPFPLLQAAGEAVPLRDACCDVVVSEYGAAIWADPRVWLGEAARLLRPGGELAFLGSSVAFLLCCQDDGSPPTAEMRNPQRGMHRWTWPDDPAVEFHVSHGEMLRLLRAAGFEVLDLIEVYAPEGAADATLHDGKVDFVTAAWARRWPIEEVWRARRT
ncbi:class I SAM-dependent methyltransferase [Iamia majanohamensis]|uniref:Class I SAM-dependent methyltransferase n=1 Tax=Iamia majanohamensis TaxID=467976 RepID=A0AAE9Y859_9ACTN|nr:class I SAM-dependent methyltransferase [Iamia majanohamensis]WCO67486.1 class I SAM-dependent methyltransferase [Iamia majanohamensis]